MTVHHLSTSRFNTHGYFSRDLTPALTVDSGDTVILKTLNAGWHMDPDPESDSWDPEQRVPWYDEARDRGHALNGPIFVRGATPGTTLEIAIEEVVTGGWGWSVGGGNANELNSALHVDDFPPHTTMWWLDDASGVASTQTGHRIRMRPFLGVLGMPPDEPGEHPTGPPRFCGGNIDCKELVAGTRLYLPISVDGALLSAGDGHGAQADGEVSGVAIECPMDRVHLKLTVLDNVRLKFPRAWTPRAWLTFGFDADLDVAVVSALDGMLDLLLILLDIDRKEAIELASLIVDLRVTQIVNGVKGVHAVLPHDSFVP